MPADHDAPKQFTNIQAPGSVPPIPPSMLLDPVLIQSASAAPEDEGRFAALMQTDFRLQAEINLTNKEVDDQKEHLAALHQRVLELEFAPPPSTVSSFFRSLLSRKFILTLIGSVIAVIGGLEGTISPEVAAIIVAALTAVYTTIEGIADAGERKAAASRQ